MEDVDFEELLVELIEALEDFLDEIDHDFDDETGLTMEMASEHDTIH
jgi:hypothetical protein